MDHAELPLPNSLCQITNPSKLSPAPFTNYRPDAETWGKIGVVRAQRVLYNLDGQKGQRVRLGILPLECEGDT